MSTSSPTPASLASVARLARGAVVGLRGAARVLVEERRLVDEDVGAAGRLADHVAGRGVAGQDDAAARPRLPDHLLRADAGDGLARLQTAERGTGLDAEGLRERRIEAPGPLVLDQGVPERAAAVAHVERLDLVAVELDRVPGADVGDVQRVGDAARRHPTADASRRCVPGGPNTSSGFSRPRRSNVFSMPGRPSQWSAW